MWMALFRAFRFSGSFPPYTMLAAMGTTQRLGPRNRKMKAADAIRA